jgi:hypothetical protein
MAQLVFTNDTNTPLTVTTPIGASNRLNPGESVQMYDRPSSGVYTVRANTSLALTFSVGTPLGARIKVAVAVPGGGGGGGDVSGLSTAICICAVD